MIDDLRNLEIEETDILTTIDVNLLYTNIIQNDGINSVNWALHKQTDMKEEQIQFILEGLKLAMNSNYFWHKGDYFVQTKGVAMGAKYSPSVANLFLNH